MVMFYDKSIKEIFTGLLCCIMLFFIGCVSVTAEKRPDPLNNVNAFYYEDFSNTEIGLTPQKWIGGDTLGVTDTGSRKVLGVIKEGKHSFTIPEIAFPENFKLYIKMARLNGCCDYLQFNVGNLDWVIHTNGESRLGDTKFRISRGKGGKKGEIILPLNEYFILTLEKTGPVFKLFLNENQLALTRKSDFQKSNILSVTTGSGGKHAFKFVISKIVGHFVDSKSNVSKLSELKATNSQTENFSESNFYYEDFSNVQAGLIPSNWTGGETFAVQESQQFRGRKVLTRIKDGRQSFAIPNLDFSDNFKFDIEMVILEGCCDYLQFTIGNLDWVIHTNGESRLGESPFRLSTRMSKKHAKLPIKTTFLLTLEKTGPVFKLLINGRQVAITRKSDFQKSDTFSITTGRGGDDSVQIAILKIVGKVVK